MDTKELNELKIKVLDICVFNAFKGYTGLYFTNKEMKRINKIISHCEDLTIKQLYESLLKIA